MSEISNVENAAEEQAPEKRTISTSRLERLRESIDFTVEQFIEALLAYEVENPSESFKESLTKFGEKITTTMTKTKKSPTEKEPDWDKLTVEYLVEMNLYPISGILNRMQSSRKYEGDHVYSVNIEQGPGTKAQTICDLTDLSAVRIEINGVLLKVIDVLEKTEIPNRVYKQGYNPDESEDEEPKDKYIAELLNPRSEAEDIEEEDQYDEEEEDQSVLTHSSADPDLY